MRSAVDRPTAVVLAGPPCSGKSTLAIWLARELPGIHLEVDAILTAILPASDRRLEDRLLGYDVTAHAVRPVLERNLSAILDCTYSRRAFRRQVIDNMRIDDALVVIEFLVTPEVALARFRGRSGHAATDMTEDLVVDRAKSYPYGHGSGTVDSEGTVEKLREQVMDIIKRERPLDREKWIEAGI